MIKIINLAKLLLIIGGIIWGFYGAFDLYILDIIPSVIIQKIICSLIGIAAIILIFNKNYFLTHLDNTFIPYPLLNNDNQPVNSNYSTKISVQPNSKVLYWAASSLNNNEDMYRDVQKAYGDFANSGIVTADASGNAQLLLKIPGPYTIHNQVFSRTLIPHIHYRYTLNNNILSKIYTIDINPDNNDLNKKIHDDNIEDDEEEDDESCKIIKEKFTQENLENLDNIENIYENDEYYFDDNYTNI